MAGEMVSESYNKIFSDKAKMYIQCIAAETVRLSTVKDGSLFKNLSDSTAPQPKNSLRGLTPHL
jgi:hypothetical protein